MAFSPVDRIVASCSSDKTIRIWSMTDHSCLKVVVFPYETTNNKFTQTFEGHAAGVLRFAFLTSGMQLLSTAGDGVMKLWTIKTNECVNTFDGHDAKVKLYMHLYKDKGYQNCVVYDNHRKIHRCNTYRSLC